MLERHACLAALALAVACNKTEPPTEPEPVVEVAPVVEPRVPIEPPIEPEPSVEPTLFAGIDLTRDPTRVGEDLAKHWCERGGEAFRPPAKPGEAADEDYPFRLANCGEVTVKRQHHHQDSGLTATLFTLDAVYESRELVLLQTETHAALVELDHDLDDTSGMAGTVWRELLSVELRDLTGSSTPEWIAEVRESGGDNYEADRCYATEADARDLIVCSETTEGFACFDTVYHSTRESEPRPASELGECDMARKDLEPRSMSGYAMTVALRRDTVVFSRSKTKIHEPGDPPYVGEVAMPTLFAEAELAVGVFEQLLD